MKRVLQVMIEPHTFSTRDIVGGDPSLDFVNTVTGRDQSSRDWLDSYERLIEWAVLASSYHKTYCSGLPKKQRENPPRR